MGLGVYVGLTVGVGVKVGVGVGVSVGVAVGVCVGVGVGVAVGVGVYVAVGVGVYRRRWSGRRDGLLSAGYGGDCRENSRQRERERLVRKRADCAAGRSGT